MNRKEFILKSGLGVLAISAFPYQAISKEIDFISMRPALPQRTYSSPAVEVLINEVKSNLSFSVDSISSKPSIPA